MNKPIFDFRRGFVAYPDLPPDADGAKAPYIDHGTAPPDKTRYFSQEEMELAEANF